MLTDADAQWRSFFAGGDEPAYEVIYEDVVRGYEPTVRGVLGFLGVPEAGTREHGGYPKPHTR